MPFCDAVDVNPRRPITRGALAPFVDMAALPAETRDVSKARVKYVGSGGSRFTNGDTLFARITPCTENGKTGLVGCLAAGEVATGSTEFIVLGPRQDLALPRYVYYLAKNPTFRSFAVSRMRGTSGRQRVPANVFDDFEVGVPPLPEQRNIAAILSSVDDAIGEDAGGHRSGAGRQARPDAGTAHAGPPGAAHAVQVDGDWGEIPARDQRPRRGKPGLLSVAAGAAGGDHRAAAPGTAGRSSAALPVEQPARGAAGEQAQAQEIGLDARGFAIYGLLERQRPMNRTRGLPGVQ